MSSELDSNSGSDYQDPYSMLGLNPGASFEEIQKARDCRLNEVGEDPISKAKIESSYDALLMSSLKERQLGKASTEAISASKKEESLNNFSEEKSSSIFPKLSGIKTGKLDSSLSNLLPELSFPVGQALYLRLSLALLSVVLILVSSQEVIELILSLSTISVFISQIRRGRKTLPSLGLSVLLLSIGLLLGAITSGINISSELNSPFLKEQIEAIPAVLLLWTGVLLLGE